MKEITLIEDDRSSREAFFQASYNGQIFPIFCYPYDPQYDYRTRGELFGDVFGAIEFSSCDTQCVIAIGGSTHCDMVAKVNSLSPFKIVLGEFSIELAGDFPSGIAIGDCLKICSVRVEFQKGNTSGEV